MEPVCLILKINRYSKLNEALTSLICSLCLHYRCRHNEKKVGLEVLVQSLQVNLQLIERGKK